MDLNDLLNDAEQMSKSPELQEAFKKMLADMTPEQLAQFKKSTEEAFNECKDFWTKK